MFFLDKKHVDSVIQIYYLLKSIYVDPDRFHLNISYHMRHKDVFQYQYSLYEFYPNNIKILQQNDLH